MITANDPQPISSTGRPPNRVERLLAKASLLKLDPDAQASGSSALHTRHSAPLIRRSKSDETDASIEMLAQQARQRQAALSLHGAQRTRSNSSVYVEDPQNEEDEDVDEDEDPAAFALHTQSQNGVNPSDSFLLDKLDKRIQDPRHPLNPIRKLSSFDQQAHPHRAAIHQAINRAPFPFRFVGSTFEFVGNTAVNIVGLPVDAIAKGIRRGRGIPADGIAEGESGEAARIGWEHVDPSFPQGYSTTVLGLDENVTSRNQALHALVTTHRLPKMYPYPAPVNWGDASMIKVRETFVVLYVAVFLAFSAIWYLLTLMTVTRATNLGWSWFSFLAPLDMIARTLAIAIPGIALCIGISMVQRRVEKQLESRRNTLFTTRATALVPPMPESVEWLNAAIAAVWKQIDPALFVPLADQVEDVMQMSLPGFVDAVKVDDIGIGVHAFQLVALRSLRAKTPDGQDVNTAADLAQAYKVKEETQARQRADRKAQRPQDQTPGSFLPSRSRSNRSLRFSNQDGVARGGAGTQLQSGHVPFGHPEKPGGGGGPENAPNGHSSGFATALGQHQSIGSSAPSSYEREQQTDVPDGESVCGREGIKHRVLPPLQTPHNNVNNPSTSPAKNSPQTIPISPSFDSKPGPDGNETEQEDVLGESLQEQQINVQDESGGFVHLEASFSYSARKGSRRADNIHLMIQFFIGAMKLFQIPFPVWVQIEKISGTIRLRAQLVSEPPYIRNVTFALMGVPRIEVNVVPMASKFVNVLDIPLVSDFVQSSIAAAANAYVAPQSMTLNLSDILSGDGVKKDTDAVGILAIHINYARGLSSQDANGFSDPYIIVSLAKFGRPLYYSRIVRKDLNPVWNEYAFVLVTKNDVKNDEYLSLQLWDWDRHSPDDIIGRVSRSVRKLMRRPNEWHTYTDPLRGFEEGTEMEGHLTYRVAFFDKAPLGQPVTSRAQVATHKMRDDEPLDQVALHLRDQEKEIELAERRIMRERDDERDSDSQSITADKQQWQQKRSDRARRAAIALEAAETLRRPPNPDFPSGILFILVERIDGLENRDVERGVSGKAREGGAGQDVDNESASKRIPSSYAEVLLNAVMVFRTRTKQNSNTPFFNAGIELMVRDWKTANVTVCVRDARLREHDPIMGLVSLNLPELFATTSQVSRKFSLSDGVAFGKVQCSFVFRSVYLDLPRTLRGAEVATVEIMGPITLRFPPSEEVLRRGGAPVEAAQSGNYESWKRTLDAGKLIVTVGGVTHKLDLWQYNPQAHETRSYLAQYTHRSGHKISHKKDEPAPTTTSTQSVDESKGNPSSDEHPISLLCVPLYDRYQTPIIFGINPHMGISTLSARKKCDAYATQWLGDLPDSIPKDTRGGAVGGPLEMDQQRDMAPITWVSLPIIAGPDAEVAIGNYIGPEAAASHSYGVVGEMRVGLRLHPGFDLSHETFVSGTTERHEFETYNRLRGMPKRAELNSHAMDDGVIDRQERAAIRRAKREALHARHRGAYGYSAVRSAAWAKDSLWARVHKVQNLITGRAARGQMVASEV